MVWGGKYGKLIIICTIEWASGGQGNPETETKTENQQNY